MRKREIGQLVLLDDMRNIELSNVRDPHVNVESAHFGAMSSLRGIWRNHTDLLAPESSAISTKGVAIDGLLWYQTVSQHD